MNTNTNTTNTTSAIPTYISDTNAYQEAAAKAYVDGLIDCYCEARDTLEVRLDVARKIADDSSKEYIDFLYNLMKRTSAEEFEKFIESNELSSTGRVTCIALFAMAHLPEDYGDDDEDTGEIGKSFDAQAELDALIKANSEADVSSAVPSDNPDLAALSRLMAKIIGGVV